MNPVQIRRNVQHGQKQRLAWFLLRVIPKPSRATYPCQRAAFPIASAFVLWLSGATAGVFSHAVVRRAVSRSKWVVVGICSLAVVGLGLAICISRASILAASAYSGSHSVQFGFPRSRSMIILSFVSIMKSAPSFHKSVLP